MIRSRVKEVRHPVQIDHDIYMDLIALRNLYSQRSGKNVSLAWVIKHLVKADKEFYLRSNTVYKTFFEMRK